MSRFKYWRRDGLVEIQTRDRLISLAAPTEVPQGHILTCELVDDEPQVVLLPTRTRDERIAALDISRRFRHWLNEHCGEVSL